MRKTRTALMALALASIMLMQNVAVAEGLTASPTAVTERTTSAPGYTRALKKGCKGADVKTLQKKLTELKFYKSTCDGLFGSGTQSSVKSFQNAHGLKADGVVGPVTYKAIYGTSSSSGGTDGGSTATLGSLNNQVTLKKGSRGNNVKDLQTVLKMKHFYSGPITGQFQNATKSAVMSFQHSVALKSDGIAGNYTLSALYTMLNPPDLSKILPWPSGRKAWSALEVEKLNWSDVSVNVWKKGMDAVVIDIRSGYTFHVRRTGGEKHADVEPLTPLDTATFYKAAGNFSWDRHPIWVILNGRRLAASMNCMPHGYDSIAGNDMRGQFCIHFVGSRTHGSNKIDPDHQACIEEAYQAGLADTPDTTPTATPTATVSPTGSPASTASVSPTATATPPADPAGTGDQLPPP